MHRSAKTSAFIPSLVLIFNLAICEDTRNILDQKNLILLITSLNIKCNVNAYMQHVLNMYLRLQKDYHGILAVLQHIDWIAVQFPLFWSAIQLSAANQFIQEHNYSASQMLYAKQYIVTKMVFWIAIQLQRISNIQIGTTVVLKLEQLKSINNVLELRCST